jgi:hypothetical protein
MNHGLGTFDTRAAVRIVNDDAVVEAWASPALRRCMTGDACCATSSTRSVQMRSPGLAGTAVQVITRGGPIRVTAGHRESSRAGHMESSDPRSMFARSCCWRRLVDLVGVGL